MTNTIISRELINPLLKSNKEPGLVVVKEEE